MEGDVCYSTVVFKAFNNDKSKAEQLPAKKSVLPPQDHQSEGVTPSISPSYRWATLCLGLLCVLLLSASIAVGILNYSSMTDNKKILTTNQQLLTHKKLLERQMEGLNSTLNLLAQGTFSLKDYCQSTENGVQCKPCPKNWIENGSSCYKFHVDHPWKTLKEGQDICKTLGAHLTVIDNIEEQEFVNKNTEYYYDVHHGYWIGLSKPEQQTENWVWTNGEMLQQGFWVVSPTDRTLNCVLTMASNNSQKSWKAEHCEMRNRWICEMTVLTWSQF